MLKPIAVTNGRHLSQSIAIALSLAVWGPSLHVAAAPSQSLRQAQATDAEIIGRGGEVPGSRIHDHLDEATRADIWAAIGRNVAVIDASQKSRRGPSARIAKTVPNGFVWPLRNAKGNNDPSYWVIANYVDQNRNGGALLDFQCQQRTYDGHAGTDISLGFDAWNVMASGQIEIVAAAAGTVVYKQDGNPDKSCVNNTSRGPFWNAVYVRHDDGSIAWYGHLKSASMTKKNVGDRVEEGEFLGTIGSSGNSSGPHLHFEVYDENQRLVDPWAGQCNTLNIPGGSVANSWWRDQKPYTDSQLNRLYTTGNPPVFGTCGSDGTMQTPGNANEKRDFKPGETLFLVATYRDQQSSQVTQYRIVRPDGSVYLQWSHSPQQSNVTAPGYVSSYWYFTRTLEQNAMPGTWMAEATFNGRTVAASFSVSAAGTPPPNYSSLWWNPAESGWGVSVAHQANTLFAAWFTYDDDRSGMWLVMPDASLQPDGSYRGTIYRTTGIPFDLIDNAVSVRQTNGVGSGTFRFDTSLSDSGTFSYTVNNTTQMKSIVRQRFGALPDCRFTTGSRQSSTNYQDLWWSPSESGWGVSITHQDDTLFVAWFTYRADGNGQWLVGSNVSKSPTGTYRGRLYRTTGLPFSGIGAGSAVENVTDVGDITLAFRDGENAEMRYTLDGIARVKTITRQNWASLRSACR